MVREKRENGKSPGQGGREGREGREEGRRNGHGRGWRVAWASE
jgi:hypothetical protein